MKKGIALILTAALLLTGCGGASAQPSTQEKTDAAQEEAVVAEEASADKAEKTETPEPAAAAENTDTSRRSTSGDNRCGFRHFGPLFLPHRRTVCGWRHR